MNKAIEGSRMIRGLITAVCLLVLALYSSAVRADDPKPVGYLIRAVSAEDVTAAENDAAEPASTSFVTRNNQRLAVIEGMEVFQSDVVSTQKGGVIAVVFRDSSAVTLRESSSLAIETYNYPGVSGPTLLNLEGKAYFSVTPRPPDSLFSVATQLGKVQVKGTKFEIFTHADGSGYKTTIAVTDGKVLVSPNGSGGVELTDGTLAVLAMATTKIAGFAGSPVEFAKDNIPKDQIKSLKIGAITDVVVSIGKKNDVKITSINKNPDGTITYIKMVEVNENTVSISTSVKDASNKTIVKITESKGKISATLTEGAISIKQSITGSSGTVQIKDGKVSYKGSVATLGNGTQVNDATNSKDKSRIVITKQTRDDGTVVKTTTKFATGATEGTRVTVVIERTGAKTSYTEMVNNVLIDGAFTPTSGKTGGASSPPLPTGAPAVITAGGVDLVPDTTPVSP